MDKQGPYPQSSGRSQYRFLRRIATGGMAELYLGEASGVGGVSKPVALKRMLPAHARDQEFLSMFLEEARLASTLQHPNIVQTYDVIQSSDEYIIVMEYLEGADLQQFRRRAHAQGVVLRLDQTLHVVRSVLSGLHYAHERTRTDGRTQGVVHRDVSPQNIFVTYDGGVKLLDFGIAKSEQSMGGTNSGVLKGKVLYMSPEQCGGGQTDRRTDIYSIGVVLFQLLTGTVPHRGKNAYDTMRSIIDDPAPSPRLINPRVAPELEAIVLRALHKRPQDRYPTARDMLSELEQFAQRNGQFVSTLGFAATVEQVLGPRSAIPEGTLAGQENEPMPAAIDLPVAPAGKTPVPQERKERATLAETEHALVRRVSGVTLLSLTGVLDERFDPSGLADHLRGEVIVDTARVSRITSFGIRSLLGLLSEARPRIEGLFHVRCSVAFINQVSMIRALLAGGKILSFQAPFIDSGTGAGFAILLQGEEGRRAVDQFVLPEVTSPSDGGQLAEFDDDPQLYLSFGQDYQAEVPGHLKPALQALEEQARKLDVELTVREDLTILTVRRPIGSDARWKRIVGGLEGRVRIDLTESPSASAAGVERFVDALDSVAMQLQSVEFTGAPLGLSDAVSGMPQLQSRVTVTSVQVDGRCQDCGSERRAVVTVSRVSAGRGVTLIPAGCTRCGGALEVRSPVPVKDRTSTPAASPRSLVPLPRIDASSVETAAKGCASRGGAFLLLVVLGGSAALAALVG
ncbi:MAG: serine/threonine protein kinase [Myxococcales bacterium]|nr:serine/threonine protein kinase [Myxococcales bacterium]